MPRLEENKLKFGTAEWLTIIIFVLGAVGGGAWWASYITVTVTDQGEVIKQIPEINRKVDMLVARFPPSSRSVSMADATPK